MPKKSKYLQSTIVSLVALGTLSACSGKRVSCTVPVADNKTITMVMREGECQSIDGSKMSKTTPDQKYDALEPYDSYIRCYGIAATGKNACGTLRGACAGTVKEARVDYAWVPLPKSICQDIGGRIVEACHATKTINNAPVMNDQKK